MKCELCSKEYRSLSNHLRRTHEVAPDDYREAYGIMKGVPLVDADVSESIRQSIVTRLEDPDYRLTMTKICKNNASHLKTTRSGKSDLSQAGAVSLAKHRKKQNGTYILSKVNVVASSLQAKKTIEDARRDTGTSAVVIKKIIAMGLASYSRKESGIESAKRSLATKRNQKQ